ncbi:hypothetical protein PsalN5692_04000 (plasmid) [Piscirickettsia salmonis]|uniref:hypothetical protein n=1 Tax=Piscirickettsia salmonis TaxID=1238 RepID=UPI0012B98BCD|nr:hypothetical protein [Piscirickettsia salmonis]QGP52491.1 hypothetical protein PsalN5692_04000 [Piscirickettsia salmonis]
MQNLKSGNAFAIVYSLVMAFSVVWVSNLESSFHESFMLIIVSVAAVIFYNLINLKSLSKPYKSILNHPLHWLAMSFSFAMTWWLTYFSAIHGSPRLIMVALYLVLAICSCIAKKHYLCASICLVSLVVSFELIPEANIINIITSSICGIFCYIYMYLSETYAKLNKLGAAQLLSIRFYFLLFFSVIYAALFDHYHLKFDFNYSHTTLIALLSIILLITFNLLPNFLAQKGVVLIGTNKFSRIITITPALTFFLEGFVHNHFDTVLMLLFVSISILLNVIERIKINKQ